MEDANTTPADTNVSEYAKNYNLPKDVVETKATESRSPELQSIKNKLFEYKKKKADIEKQTTNTTVVQTKPSVAYTKEEAEKKVESNTADKNISVGELIEDLQNASKPSVDLSSEAENKPAENTAKTDNNIQLTTNTSESQSNIVEDFLNKSKAETKQETNTIPEINTNTKEEASKIPDISDLDERLKKETADLPEPPNPNLSEPTQKNVVLSKQTIELKNSETLPSTVEEEPVFNSKPPTPVTIAKEEPAINVVNNIAPESTVKEPIATSNIPEPAAKTPDRIASKSIEPNINTVKEEVAPQATEQPKIETAKEIPEPEIPIPELPDFAELYTKNLRTIIDNFAASVSQNTNPSEAALNSIQTVIEGFARESASNTKQMSGMINRLCTAVESILRYLPSMGSQGSGIAAMPQMPQTYKDINTGLIDDTRTDFRRQYGRGVIDMANKRPTMPGFSI